MHEVQAVLLIWEGFDELRLVSLMNQKSNVGIPCPQKSKIIERNECFAAKAAGGVIRNDEFHTGIGACQHRRNELLQVFSTVKIYNDNRYFSQPDNEFGNKKGGPKIRLWVVNDR